MNQANTVNLLSDEDEPIPSKVISEQKIPTGKSSKETKKTEKSMKVDSKSVIDLSSQDMCLCGIQTSTIDGTK